MNRIMTLIKINGTLSHRLFRYRYVYQVYIGLLFFFFLTLGYGYFISQAFALGHSTYKNIFNSFLLLIIFSLITFDFKRRNVSGISIYQLKTMPLLPKELLYFLLRQQLIDLRITLYLAWLIPLTLALLFSGFEIISVALFLILTTILITTFEVFVLLQYLLREKLSKSTNDKISSLLPLLFFVYMTFSSKNYSVGENILNIPINILLIATGNQLFNFTFVALTLIIFCTVGIYLSLKIIKKLV